MLHPNRLATLAPVLVLLAALGAHAQEDPAAQLRFNEKKDAAAAEKYYVEIILAEPLNEADYALLDCYRRSAPDPAPACAKSKERPRLGYLMSKGRRLADLSGAANTVEISPDDGGERKRFRINLPEGFKPFDNFAKKNFEVNLTYKDGAGQLEELNVDVARVLEREVTTSFVTCEPERLAVALSYDPTKEAELERVRVIHDYFSELQKKENRARLANFKLEVEPLGRKGKPAPVEVRGFTMNPAVREALDINSTFSLCLDTEGALPGESFDAKLVLDEPGAPPELFTPPVIEKLEGATVQSFSPVFPDKEKGPGLRPVDKDLNIAGTLTSSVSDVEKPDKSIVRERDTRWTLDVRLGLRDLKTLTVFQTTKPPICGPVHEYTPPTSTTAGAISIAGLRADFTDPNSGPVKILPGTRVTGLVPTQPEEQRCLHFTKTEADGSFSGAINFSTLGSPVRTSALYRIWTPAYLDAKISNGKITKDTLSLNRVVLGTKLEYQYRYNNETYPTYYSFQFTGSHASDRDFKQAEYKGAVEFRPFIGSLYHPLKSQPPVLEKRELVNKDTTVPVRHGYEIVPYVGFELGRTYLRRRPAEAVKPSDTVRRLYFGLDLVYNPTDRMTFSASDTFYVRGESKDDRYRNYFIGTFDYKLGTFAKGKASHGAFLSFERGGQPPFDEADVNVLKFGYRVTADTIFSRGFGNIR